MMHQSTISLKIQAQSFGNYLQDIWFGALLFVLIQHQTTLALPFLWIGLQITIVIVSVVFFRKIGPNSIVPFVIPFFLLLPMFLFGAPIWLYAGSVVFSIWRIQTRFNNAQLEQTVDNPFILSYFFTFLTVHFVSYFLGYTDYHFVLYTVFIAGIVLFGGARLIAVSMNVDEYHASPKTNLLGIYLLSIVGVMSLSSVIYFAIPFLRKLFDLLFEIILRVALIPLAPVLEYLEDILKGLQMRVLEEEELIPEEEQVEVETKDVATNETFINFPVEWIFIVIGVVAVLFIIYYLWRNKPKNIEVEISDVHYENNQLTVGEEKETNQLNSLYQVETSYLREKYAQFELEAHTYDLDRNRSETVREWFKRMQWQVDPFFFQIYEEVRYGGKMISSEKGELFIVSIEKIKKENFLKKDV